MESYNLKDFVNACVELIQKSYPKESAKGSKYSPELSLEEFLQIFQATSLPAEKLLHVILLFNYLDVNDNNMLDMKEILVGFITLLNGPDKEKLECVFRICDMDQNGLVDIEELTNYFQITFRIGQISNASDLTQEEKKRQSKEQEDMASALSLTIFEELQIEKDGAISLEEFLLWNQKLKNEKSGRAFNQAELSQKQQQAKQYRLKSQKDKPREFSKKKQLEIVADNQQKVSNENSAINEIKMIRDGYNLHELTIDHFIEEFQKLTTLERINKSDLLSIFEKIVKSKQLNIAKASLPVVVNLLFGIFDKNGNGVLDSDELTSGISIVLEGTEKEKLQILFKIFDKNNDKKLQFKELFNLLRSAYTMFLNANRMASWLEADEGTLAFATAKKCFLDLKMELNGELDYNTFYSWHKGL